MMKQPAGISPFAARTSQEQKEQWIVWQSQHNATRSVTGSPHDTENRSVFIPIDKATRETDQSLQRTPIPQPVHHGQYDAVVKRLSMAQRRATTFVSAGRKPAALQPSVPEKTE